MDKSRLIFNTWYVGTVFLAQVEPEILIVCTTTAMSLTLGVPCQFFYVYKRYVDEYSRQ